MYHFLKKIQFIVFFVILSSFIVGDNYRYIQNTSFNAGEYFEYRVKYGFMPIGEAVVDVSPQIYLANNRPCYRINVLGRTTGLTDIFRIRNVYRTFLDTAAILPQKFVYSARENNYKRDQTITFNHNSNIALREDETEKKTFKVPDNVQDVVSGYYYLRIIDFSKMKVGDVFMSPLFFGDEIYQMKIKYEGKATLRTKFGKINVLKLHPILPKNEMFDGDEAIKIWISDDKNRVPIKIDVDFLVGGAMMELKNYRNTRYPLEWR
jgi:hypothetical protein